MGCLFMRDILFYCSSCFKSSSGVVIGAIPKFSTRYCSTLGETNAGRVGPRRIFLMPKYSRVSRMHTAFCSYQESTMDSGKSFTPQPNASASATAI